MSESPQQERYLIVFNFGSFVYMFFIIGMSMGLMIAAFDGLWNIVEKPSLHSLWWAVAGLITTSFGFGLLMTMASIIGFLPYRWLCKKGWGWPTKGVFTKVELVGDTEIET